MPFYIVDIGKKSAWHADLKKLKGKEVRFKSLEFDLIKNYFCSLSITVIRPELDSNMTVCSHLKIEWHDYPSVECRAGELD